MEIMQDKDLEMVAGGAANKTEIRIATKEECFCCGNKKFKLYLGCGGQAVCTKCGQGQVVLEWFYD
ncbi:MAG: hypothetical protein J6E42_06130 [Firmicutes bacterium]|nr:hypothetical protein [Bacillota bacterium]